MTRVGLPLRIALDFAGAASLAFDEGVGSDDEAAAWQGAALGHAFRAAELAYDLGQRHALEAQERRRREGLRLALDTMD